MIKVICLLLRFPPVIGVVELSLSMKQNSCILMHEFVNGDFTKTNGKQGKKPAYPDSESTRNHIV